MHIFYSRCDCLSGFTGTFCEVDIIGCNGKLMKYVHTDKTNILIDGRV